MANPKVIRECRRCGIDREHYTRRNGRLISPCAECQIDKAKARQSAIRDDPAKLERQRQEWTRIKKRQRVIYNGQTGTQTAEPEVQPGSIPMSERRRRRARQRAAGTPEPSAPPISAEAPLRLRRRPRRPAPTTPSMENGLDG